MSEATTAPVSDGSLTFEYELTAADIRSGLRARTRSVPRARALRVLLPLAYVVFATLLLVAAGGPGGLRGRDWGPLGVGAWCVLAVLFLPVLQARAFHRTARLQGPTRTTVAAGGIAGASARSSQSMAWSLFARYAETKDVFMLLSADKGGNCLVVLPKRALTAPGDVDRLRALLDAHLPRA
ncbi:YcxB family protein [Streptomyces sp. ISL-11]|uniref:YcxB family protein n=1 Tax=Streptomyces sp. ISL-11 TaxID=2819174 RepID=UPI001BEB0FC1|nr:YcxB family protein [Streptomyces sp. ISL-11]MBT2383537.1 YcxB family protein [Streptomyces sp. ISL-11]